MNNETQDELIQWARGFTDELAAKLVNGCNNYLSKLEGGCVSSIYHPGPSLKEQMLEINQFIGKAVASDCLGKEGNVISRDPLKYEFYSSSKSVVAELIFHNFPIRNEATRLALTLLFMRYKINEDPDVLRRSMGRYAIQTLAGIGPRQSYDSDFSLQANLAMALFPERVRALLRRYEVPG